MKIIQLTLGKFTTVDDEDFEYLSRWKWCAHKQSKTFYAVRRRGKQVLKMHREILGIEDPKQQVDHKDRNGLNNVRTNLRLANSLQNGFNKSKRVNSVSKFKGVKRTTNKGGKPWRAEIKVGGKSFHLGVFDTQQDAAQAYNLAAIEKHGAFAFINTI